MHNGRRVRSTIRTASSQGIWNRRRIPGDLSAKRKSEARAETVIAVDNLFWLLVLGLLIAIAAALCRRHIAYGPGTFSALSVSSEKLPMQGSVESLLRA